MESIAWSQAQSAGSIKSLEVDHLTQVNKSLEHPARFIIKFSIQSLDWLITQCLQSGVSNPKILLGWKTKSDLLFVKDQQKKGGTMEYRKTLAANLRSLMKLNDISSQKQLAGVTGVSQTQIGNILHCKKAASIDLLNRLSNGLNCEPWLFLVPVNLFEELRQDDFLPLVHCYSKLRPHDQTAVWDMTYELFEAANGVYSSRAEISERI